MLNSTFKDKNAFKKYTYTKHISFVKRNMSKTQINI